MIKIKVVGDIQSGQLQPTLTGNPIVDNALLQRFTQQLTNWLQFNDFDADVVLERHFRPTALEPRSLLLIDEEIVPQLNLASELSAVTLLIPHSDLLHGDSTSVLQQVRDFLENHPTDGITQSRKIHND